MLSHKSQNLFQILIKKDENYNTEPGIWTLAARIMLVGENIKKCIKLQGLLGGDM